MPKPNHLDTLLDDLIETPVATIEHDNRTTPNKFPLLKNFPYKIAIIGEAPGADEISSGEPFVGQSGRELNKLLSKKNVVRSACFVGNICQHRPPVEKVKGKLKQTSPLEWAKKSERGQLCLAEGVAQLEKDIREFNPNICLLLGNNPLYFALDNANVGDWRGSIFICDKPGPFFGRKCIASYHPSAIFQQYEFEPLVMFDIEKCFRQATTKDFTPPYRDLKLFTDVPTLLVDLQKILDTKPLIAIDIEGWVDKFVCISIAPSHDYSFIVPFSHRDGRNFYSTVDDEFLVWRLLTTILADPTIPKVLQNSLYDRFVLQYSYDVIIAGVVDDTMLKNHELYCELEKSLGFMCSIYTDEPYYKAEGKSLDRDTFWRYCCRDSATTFEINEKINQWLTGPSRQHYQFNIDLLNPLLYMECRGILYNTQLAKERLNEVNSHIYSLQAQLDKATGFGVDRSKTPQQLLEQMREVMCYKRDSTQAKKEFLEAYRILSTQLTQPLDEAFFGHYSIACKLDLNIKGKKFKDYIYKTLECPKQYHPATGELTTNYEALLKISKKIPHPAIKLAIDIGELRTRSQMLEIHADKDGRIRCGYNVVGTETGRLTCYTSPSGSGYNLTTIPDENPLKALDSCLRKGMRDLIVADEDSFFLKFDLKGADGWTVGAWLNFLGDPTMLDDLLFGIKPAQILCFMLRHGPLRLQGKSRTEIKELLKEVKKDDWDYFACKQCIWGFCYLMGPRKASTHVFNISEGQVDRPESEFRELQRLLFARYNVKLWHDHMTRFLSKQSYPPKLTSASGLTRRFFGRYNEILGEALAHEPQANTTFATNSAALRLWNDPENRLGNKLVVEPIHQVHDELLMQCKQKDLEFAKVKIAQWFDNPMVIAGQRIVIPADGSYGTNWAMDEKSKVGSL